MSEEKGKTLSTVFCGLSTALYVISALVSPVCMFLWLGASIQMPQDTVTMDKMVTAVICCGAVLLISLLFGIIAKVNNRRSKWAVVCIVLSIVFLVIGALAALFFIWAASQYHYA